MDEKVATYRFFAAPNPPGKTTASNCAADNWPSGLMFPRAILADSTSTLLTDIWQQTYINQKKWQLTNNYNVHFSTHFPGEHKLASFHSVFFLHLFQKKINDKRHILFMDWMDAFPDTQLMVSKWWQKTQSTDLKKLAWHHPFVFNHYWTPEGMDAGLFLWLCTARTLPDTSTNNATKHNR